MENSYATILVVITVYIELQKHKNNTQENV